MAAFTGDEVEFLVLEEGVAQFAASAIHGGRSSRQMLHTTLLCDVFSDLEMLEVGEMLGSK